MNPAIRYGNGSLDRASDRRQNDEWIRRALGLESTRFVLNWRYRHGVVRGVEGPRIATVGAMDLERSKLEEWKNPDDAERLPPLFLGLRGEEAIFALDLDPTCEPLEALGTLAERPENGGGSAIKFMDLRHVGPLLPAPEASLMAFARGLIYWHRHHRFCSRCGHPAAIRQGGHQRLCIREECAKPTFPRTDPAVIMLVEHQPEDGPPLCLLGRGPRWPPGSFSTLAGFVEPGESLEETVVREVQEEAGIEVADVRYRGSQPWPFPASLMLGFRARALSTELQPDPEELVDAAWWSAEELANFGEWGDEDAELRLPRKDSIARFLVDEWLAEQGVAISEP